MFASRLRRVLTAAALLAVALIGTASFLAHYAPKFWQRFKSNLGADGAIPSVSVPAWLPAVAIATVAISAVTVAALVAARLLGRYLRHAGEPGHFVPGLLRPAIVRARARMAPQTLEIKLGRDSLAEPYEVAKLFDGLSGVLRPRSRTSHRTFLGPDPLGLSIFASGRDRTTRFFLHAAPARQPTIAARLRATYRDVLLEPVGPLPIDIGFDVVRLKKNKRSLYALQTTKDYQHSSVESLMATMHGEGIDCLVQFAVTPTTARREARAAKALQKRERQLASQTTFDANEPGLAGAVAQKGIRGAVEGIGRALYWFDLRVCVPQEHHDAALRLAGVLNENRGDNELRPRTIRVRRRIMLGRVRRAILSPFPALRTGIVSAAELAGLWHLPSTRIKSAGIERSNSRVLEAPASISRDPDTAVVYDDHGPLGIKTADRRYGWAIMGAAGGGKTSLMVPDFANVVRDYSRAVILVDPKEDFARDAMHLVPHDRVVHYLDLGKPYAGFNVLALRHLSPQVRADILIAALRETAGEGSIQSRSDEFLRSAITAVCVVEEAPTLFHVRRMLDPFDPSYREWVVRELAGFQEVDFIRDYWDREFPAMVQANARFVAEAVNAPRNKLSRFLAVPALQLLVTHPVQIDLEGIIDRREILIVNGSKGSVGEGNAVLFGQLVILQLQKTLHQLQRRDRSSRFPVRLLVDEAHNFFSPSFATMLSEGRSAGLEVTAAFQYTAQIEDERVKAGIKSLLQNISVTRLREFEDARNIAALAMEVFSDNIGGQAEDQRRLTIDPMDIVNMPNYRPLHLWLVDGAPQPAFNQAKTWPVEPMIATPEAIATAEHHHQAQRERGWHPYDDGRPIMPPLVWTTDTAVQDIGRSVYVDLGAWHGLKNLSGGVVDIAIALGRKGRWEGYQAVPVDDAQRRWAITVPEEPGADGWLPDGDYGVRILITDTENVTHQWTPAVKSGEDETPESARVELATPETFVPLESRKAA
jgi:hypothetical protein